VISVGGKNNDEFTLSTERSLKLSAYTQVRYTDWQQGIDGFRIRRARVGLKGDILKNIKYNLQIETAKSPVLLDALIEINIIPHTKLSFGQYKVPFSLENLTSSSALDTINRSLTVERLCPSRDIGAKGRDIGISVKGQISKIAFIMGVFNGTGINTTDNNDQKDLAGRLEIFPGRFLALGLSYYNGRYSPDTGAQAVRRDRTGIDFSFVRDRLSIKAEYIVAKDDLTERYGWYAQGCYFFLAKKIQALIKYDCFDENKDIQKYRISVITLGLNWFFSRKTKLQINYEYHEDESTEVSNNVFLVQFQAGF